MMKGRDGGKAAVALHVGQKHFAAPNRAVAAIARAVKGNADDRLEVIVLGHARQDVGVMVLYLQDRQSNSSATATELYCRCVSQTTADGFASRSDSMRSTDSRRASTVRASLRSPMYGDR